MPIKAIIFDAYGTLFDVYSVETQAESLFPGHGTQLASIWRDKQIEYSRLRTLCNQYADFWQITEDALEFACEKLGQALTVNARTRLMSAYAELVAFPENTEALEQLKAMGIPLSILSNGTPWMLEQAVTASGLSEFFDHILSVDTVRRFKTAPEAYQMGLDTFGYEAGDILFVSSNCWDAIGATWFGYRTIWLNRYDLPLDRLGVVPHRIGTSLQGVVDYARELNTWISH